MEILDSAVLELWYLVRSAICDAGGDAGMNAGEAGVEGWAQSRYIQVYGDGETGRIDRGNAGELTPRYIQAMVNDRFFWPALTTTLLLMVIIIPLQFVLAIIMALIIQAQLKGSGFFLYVFAIALGVSDLAVGIVWYAIFTQYGYLNSILQSLGLIDAPVAYLTADTRYWIIIAICLAEIWRATAIVMVVVVSGLQAISTEVLEAADLFGAGLWKRLRYVILPMLRPSLQVALILRTILALQVFAVVIALSGGDIVTVLANEAYRQYYDLRNINVAAAYAGLILLLSMVSAVFYLRTVRTQRGGPNDCSRRTLPTPARRRHRPRCSGSGGGRCAGSGSTAGWSTCPGHRDLPLGAGADLVYRLHGVHDAGVRACLSEGGAALYPLLAGDDALLSQLQRHHPGDDQQHCRGDHHAGALDPHCGAGRVCHLALPLPRAAMPTGCRSWRCAPSRW